MSDFQREERYVVFKIADLTHDQRVALSKARIVHTIPTRECVVVEHDWPIYEETWENVQRLAEGRESIGAELALKRQEYDRLIGELAAAMGYDAPRPSLCDLVAEAAQVNRERDALAARYTALADEVRAMIQDSDGLAGYHLNGDVACWSEFDVGHLLSETDEVGGKIIDRLKAQWQAEILEVAKSKIIEDPHGDPVAKLEYMAYRMRRQAEGGDT
ncbi:hypothetical protein HLV40_07330 [Chromohalobacter salexigens]|nr:hypothetical protein [Chromohalobacter salexigens]